MGLSIFEQLRATLVKKSHFAAFWEGWGKGHDKVEDKGWEDVTGVTGWHGSCHGWHVKKSPSLLCCHGVTGHISGESAKWDKSEIRNQKSEGSQTSTKLEA